jgi:hypothetical protein
MDKMKSFFAHLLGKIQGFCQNYDSKLAALKAEAGVNESMGESVHLTGKRPS